MTNTVVLTLPEFGLLFPRGQSQNLAKVRILVCKGEATSSPSMESDCCTVSHHIWPPNTSPPLPHWWNAKKRGRWWVFVGQWALTDSGSCHPQRTPWELTPPLDQREGKNTGRAGGEAKAEGSWERTRYFTNCTCCVFIKCISNVSVVFYWSCVPHSILLGFSGVI